MGDYEVSGQTRFMLVVDTRLVVAVYTLSSPCSTCAEAETVACAYSRSSGSGRPESPENSLDSLDATAVPGLLPHGLAVGQEAGTAGPHAGPPEAVVHGYLPNERHRLAGAEAGGEPVARENGGLTGDWEHRTFPPRTGTRPVGTVGFLVEFPRASEFNDRDASLRDHHLRNSGQSGGDECELDCIDGRPGSMLALSARTNNTESESA